jgi:hypothetical protein
MLLRLSAVYSINSLNVSRLMVVLAIAPKGPTTGVIVMATVALPGLSISDITVMQLCNMR